MSETEPAPGRAARIVSSLTASLLASIARLVSGASVIWLDCRPEPRARIYFANHSSHLDFILLWSALPPELRARTRPVAASDYWDRPGLRGFLARSVFRAVLVDRPGPAAAAREPDAPPVADGRAREDVIARLAGSMGKDGALILFPEGTRGSGEALGAFRSGIYRLARLRPDADLVPVWLENLNRILPKGHVLPAPLLARVVFGPPLQPLPGEQADAFLARARAALLRLREA